MKRSHGLKKMLRSFLRQMMFPSLFVLTLVGVYTIIRLLFAVYNWSLLHELSLGQVALAFVYGWRFDLAAILLINFPFLLYWIFVAEPFKILDKSILLLFMAWNILLLAINVADVELFNFNGKRLTLDYFKLSQDWENQFFQVLAYYWGLVAIWLFISALFVKTCLMIDKSFRFLPEVNCYRVWHWVFGVLLLALVVVGVRGGLQLKPLRGNHAYVFSSPILGVLALNSSFTLAHTQSIAKVERPRFFKSMAEAQKYLKSETSSISVDPRLKGSNVLILLLESFALEYMGVVNGGEGHTAFLDELSRRSVFFKNNFANGRRSVEAVPAVLASIPSLMEVPLILSDFHSNEIIGLGTVLAEEGYSTHFFHGAENGSMFFDSFTKRLGFANYYGLDEYEGAPEDNDGNWGIYDEPYLQYVADQLDQVSQPFLAGIFTLSSHHPYQVPPQYRERFKGGTLEIHKSIEYADYSLRQFFSRIEKSPWYKNTLFVVVADHTSKLERAEYQNDLGHFRVPLLFFHPSVPLPSANPDKITQQVDIMPSILDLLQIDEQRLNLFGESVWRPGGGRAFARTTGGYWWIDEKYFVVNRGSEWQTFSHEKTWNLRPSEASPSRINQLKAVIQYFFDGLYDNSWYRTHQTHSAGRQAN